MQASKIKAGELYAIRRAGEVIAIRVEEVVTLRKRDKTYNTIKATRFDVVANEPKGAIAEYEPEDIVGEYTATKAEEDAKEAKRAESQRQAKAAEARAIATLEALAKHFGVPRPVRHKEYGSLRYSHDLPFRLDYGDKIEVTKQGMEILAAFFKIDEQQQEEQTNVVNLSA